MTVRISLVTLLATILAASSAAAQDSRALSELSPASRDLLTTDAGRGASALQQSQRRDSRWNGVLIGVVAGAIPGVLVGMGIKTYCYNEARDCDSAVPIVGALGGLIGGFIGGAVDDAIGNSITNPRPLPPPAVRFSVRF